MIRKYTDCRKIKSPDYADSQERMNMLRNMVIDGQDARAVKKYAQLFCEECEKEVLRYAQNGQLEKMKEAALEYKVASKFCEMLDYAATLGEKKEEILRSKSGG